MRKIGVSLKIDVTKIDKARLFDGKKGKYLDATVFIDLDNKGEYGDNGMITQDVSKQEKEAGERGAILGNATIFWSDSGARNDNQASQRPSSPSLSGQQNEQDRNFDNFDDDIPFR